MALIKPTISTGLTNQLTVSQGADGTGKTVFGFSMPSPIAFFNFDHRSYSARLFAQREFGAEILEPDFLSSGDLREGLQMRQVEVKGRKGKYKVWQLDLDAATECLEKIEIELAQIREMDYDGCPSVFIDNGRQLYQIVCAVEFEGKVSNIPQMAHGRAAARWRSLIAPFQRDHGCDKHMLISHHVKPKYVNDEWDGVSYRPDWCAEAPKLADNLIEHYIGDDGKPSFRVLAKCADNGLLMGEEIDDIEMVNYESFMEMIWG